MARLGWACLLLLFPERLLRAAGETGGDRKWRVIARVLGVRHIAQVWYEHRWRRERIEIAAAIDTLHAASAFTFGVLDRRHRRVAFVDAAAAGAFAGWDALGTNTR